MENPLKEVIVFASDHNGLTLKSHLINYLGEKGYQCLDLGPSEIDGKVDYPDYAFKLAKMIDKKEVNRGILICGTGQGMSIMANKLPNVRAAVVHNLESAPLSREHNDSNVLCLGYWITTEKRSELIVDDWLNTKFGEGRHIPRINKISEIAKNYFSEEYSNVFNFKEKLVFINGVFDVLHKGHIELIKFAKSLGGKLIVAINSDNSVKELKGPDRPINTQEDRKHILESIKDIDEVVIFDDTNTFDIINKIKPNVVVKGGEWTSEEVRYRDRIPNEIEIKIFPLIKDYSTTSTIEKIYKK